MRELSPQATEGEKNIAFLFHFGSIRNISISPSGTSCHLPHQREAFQLHAKSEFCECILEGKTGCLKDTILGQNWMD
jgi:hypothetical protein